MRLITQILLLVSIILIAFTSTRIFGMPLSWMLSICAVIFLFTTEFLLRGSYNIKYFFNHPWWASAVLIFLGGILSFLRSIDYANNMKEMIQVVWMLLVMPPILMLTVRKWPKQSLWALTLGISLNSAIAVWDKLTMMGVGPVIATANISTKGIFVPLTFYAVPTLFYSGNRYAGVLNHPNALGQITIVGFSIILAFMAVVVGKKSFMKSLLLILLMVIVYWSNILSGSVSGFIGINIAGLIVVFGLLFWKVTYPKLLILCLFLLAIIILVMLYADNRLLSNTLNKWWSTNYTRVSETTGPVRVELMRSALSQILDNPFVGYGMDLKSGEYFFERTLTSKSYYYTETAVVVHNGLLKAWLEGGFFAFLGTLLAYYIALRLSLKHIILFFQKKSSVIMLGLSAAVIGWFFVDMVQPTFFAPYTWISAFLLVGEIDVDL